MAFIKQIEDKDATGLLRRIYDASKARAGYVANIIKVMSCDPAATEVSMQFYVGVMKTRGPLSRARRELLAAVVSNVNACYY